MADLVPIPNPAPPRAAGLPCPVCRIDLVLADRQGIEIDYCPKCRGIWLDRGELDKIIERNASYEDSRPASANPVPGPAPAPQYAPPPPWGGGYGEGRHGGGHGGGGHGGGHGGYRPGGFLGGLFRH